ncbi:MAG: DUF6152 family protein [Candidatus Poribacteria bacterium]
MNIIRQTAAIAAALIVVPPLAAHHSDAGMDMETVLAFEGTVKEFAWRNPHVYVVVETEQSGEPVDWELQMGPVNVIARRGWSSDSLVPGDEVTVRTIPMTTASAVSRARPAFSTQARSMATRCRMHRSRLVPSSALPLPTSS